MLTAARNVLFNSKLLCGARGALFGRGVRSGVGLDTASARPNPTAALLRPSLYGLKVNIEVCDLMLM